MASRQLMWRGIKVGRVSGLVCLATLSMWACRATRPGEESAAAHAAVERLQQRFRQTLPKPTTEFPTPSHPVLDASAVDHFEADHDTLHPVFSEAPKTTQRKSEVVLPARADGAFKLADPESGVSIEVTLEGAKAAAAETASGLVVYRGAFHGGDILHRPTLEGTEDYIWLDEAPSDAKLTYDVQLGGKVAGLRLVANTLEFMDEHGAPRLRVAPPYLLGADGHRHAAALHLADCAADTNPTAPWDRPVARPGASQCRVEVDWKGAGAVAYPAVVDPGWVGTATMISPRYQHAAVLLQNGKVLIAGGMASASTADVAGTELFDPSTNTSASAGNFTARHNLTLTVLSDGRVLAAGGATGSTSLTTTEIYNPSSGWTSGPSMAYARSTHTATLLSTGKVMIAGGTGTAGADQTAEFFNPTSSNFTGGTSSMNYHHAQHFAAALQNGKVLVAGGVYNSSATSGSELYDPSAGTWTAAGSLNQARYNFGGALLNNGNVLIVGGYNGGSIATAELFVPSSNGWFNTNSMSLSRTEPSVNGLSGNSVLVAGGFNSSSGGVQSSEIYNQATASWTSGGSMAAIRYYAAGVTLSDGRIIVTGGYGSASVQQTIDIFYLPQTCTATSDCLSGFCANGYCCNTACSGGACDRCDVAGQQGACTIVSSTGDGSPSCSPYLCSGTSTSCATSCSSDANCASGYYCNGSNQCVIKQTQGTSCSAANQCSSGFCADGFCCNTACSGGCDTCAAALGASANGTCTLFSAGAAGTPSCSPFVCTGSSGNCPTTCSSDTQCISGYYCNSSGQCAAKIGQGNSCTANNQCQTGFCSDSVCCNTACSGGCDVCSAALGATANGTCTVSAKGAGDTSPACAPFSCDGTSTSCTTTCAADTDCAANAYCAGTVCKFKQAQGTTCTASNQCTTGNCVDGYCCNTACAGQCDACSVAAGGNVNGTCSLMSLGSAGTPSCAPLVCTGSSANCPNTCANDTQCAGGYYCSSTTCVPKLTQGSSCTASNQCATGNCADGVCCNTACSGSCDVCSAALGAPSDGTCTVVPAGTTGSPSCGGFLCNGSTASCPTSCATDGDCISGDYCNASKQCVAKQAQGASCTANNQCTTGNCVDGFCCNTACGGSCDVCSSALGASANGTCTLLPHGNAGYTCTPYACTGTSASCGTTCSVDGDCASSAYCSGTTCVPKQAQGTSCTASNQCTSGSCVDGFCCNTACGGSCDVCSAALGASANGTCTLLTAGKTGSPSCSPYLCSGTSASCPTTCTADSQCVAGDYCDATGHCATKLTNGATCSRAAMCGSGNCVDGYCCNTACANGCDACNLQGSLGTCATSPQGVAGANPACSPYVCDGVNATCPTTCTSNLQCPSGTYCASSGSCLTLQANGTACSGSNQCSSGNCVDGFCCNSACGGSCDVCAGSLGATANGLCTVLPAGRTGTPSCSPYLCSGTSASCPTTCTTDTQCAATDYCDSTGHCAPVLSNGTQCQRDRQCTSTHCADGVCCNSACGGSCDFCTAALGATADGNCTDVAGATGSPSCAPFLCSATQATCPTTCSSDSQCANGAYCATNGTCQFQQPLGGTCARDGMCTSGHCADGVCCNTACAGACDACTTAKGASTNGTCTILPAGNAGSPSCTPYVCGGTSAACLTTCNADTDCASGDYCNPSHQCVPVQNLGATCSRDRQCGSSHCADGVCCNSACGGSCDFCTAALGATSDGACTVVANAQGSPSCGLYLCGTTSANCPTSCTGDWQCASNAYCSNGQCVPKQANGVTCSATDQCQSGFCSDGVCCNSACGGACDTCLASLGAPADGTCGVAPQGAVGWPTCNPYVCDGANTLCPTACKLDADCASSMYCSFGACVPKRSLGVSCVANNQCSSSFCADGVCCNGACNGSCDSCNLNGLKGQCSPLPAGQAGTPSCGAYACDGANATCPTACMTDLQCASGYTCYNKTCQPKSDNGQTCSAGQLCKSGNCVDGVCCDKPCGGGCDVCAASLGASQDGTCTVVPAGMASPNNACNPYTCDGSSASCPVSCNRDTDCVTGDFCNTLHRCVPKQTNGAACSTSAQCGSGFCVDGVCCNTSCTDLCASCNVAPNPGTCSPVMGQPMAAHGQCPAAGTTCGGFCDGMNTTACAFPDTTKVCGAASCDTSNESIAAPHCDGQGACATATPVACTPYVCAGGACPSQCMADTDCVEGSACDNGACTPLKMLGESCAKNSLCMSGFCVDGVCCESTCAGSCAQCNAPNKEGQCVPLAAGTAPETGDCAPLLCDGSNLSCPALCITSADCGGGLECRNGSCVPTKSNGTECTSSAECGSGFCVDGVCCESACEGSCATCAAAGKEGQCTFVAGAPATGRPACEGSGAVCGGSCDGTQAACSYPKQGTSCAPAFCSDGVAQAASVCDGAGQCSQGQTTSCVAGCAGDHCAATPLAHGGGCASTEPTAAALPLVVGLWLRRRKAMALR